MKNNRIMTRQEEIRKAVDIQFPIVLDGRTQEQALAASGFELGVKWADKHPINVWHDVSEEPKIGSLILLIMQSGTAIVAKIIEPNHTFNHGERWAYISDILPKDVINKNL